VSLAAWYLKGKLRDLWYGPPPPSLPERAFGVVVDVAKTVNTFVPEPEGPKGQDPWWTIAI
jgi:hypothetical protein